MDIIDRNKLYIEGSIVSSDEIEVASTARRKAENYTELFHCTRSNALLSIIEKKEFWLGSLKCVNDREEKGRIDVPTFEKSFYVACFSHQNNVTDEHWKEYADLYDGVLFSVKKEWFQRGVCFIADDKKKCLDIRILTSTQDAVNLQIKQGNFYGAFSMFEFGFYQVIYDDVLYSNLKQNGHISSSSTSMDIDLIIPSSAGIVKKKYGLSYRDENNPKIMHWEDENEVRLKVGIWRGPTIDEMPFYCRRIAVPLIETAFQSFSIRFSPLYPEEKKTEFIEKIKSKVPNCDITLL